MRREARILVATEVVIDAQLVRRLLSDEFDNISISTNPDRAVQDFDKYKPEVLILAFDNLEKAERYYLGLYRLSAQIHTLPHRTVILCNKDDLKRVYELCKKEYFDDYILFWPMVNDTPRLPMAVIHALRQSSNIAEPSSSEFAAQARRIAELEAMLSQYVQKGEQRINQLREVLREKGSHINTAIDGFFARLSGGSLSSLVDIKDKTGFQRELDQLKQTQIARGLEDASESIQPINQWVESLSEEFAPQIEAARGLQTMASKVKPMVMVVDDDDVQHFIIGHLLGKDKFELLFASSGNEALTLLRRNRPQLIFMDQNLPDMPGTEATRRIKAIERFAEVPVIMITGVSERNVVVESRQAGAIDFIVKPIAASTLREKVQRFLRI
ncbi:MAG: response regulator [Rhodocyclaceae bacterium]|nr:response regulator [Rhodocyclaceae bacterium]